jgi:uridine kinase
MTHEMKVIIIAGPNGAGKTTFAREFNSGLEPVLVDEGKTP